ncbi:MAG TPA: POTRA domain-containing protein [Pseudomonadales bacterium]|nr:POTRA domain-containing protein [Pseudomonadales bacterium]
MLALANIFKGLAAETNPPAVIEDLFAAPLPAATNPSPALMPALNVRAYVIHGDTLLPPQEFSVLSNYTGKVNIQRVHEGLDKLQSLYRDSGITGVAVTLPEQKFTNGIVQVEVVESGTALSASLDESLTNLFLAPEPKKSTFEVRGYRIDGNSVLLPEEFGMLSNYCGQIDFARLREGLGKLQLRYRELGYATVSVTLPRQKLTNGIVHVKIVEGELSEIVIEGNRYYSDDNIRQALPSLTTNILLNTTWFQRELDQANANRDRQIYPVISPGTEPGTTKLELKVKDRFPLHGRIEVNDKATPGTPLLRLDSALQYNNLWQRNQQIGVDYNFSPQAYKPPGSVNGFWDQPLIASYSAYYRIPLGFGGDLRENLDRHPATFGFNEVTHQFDLPPATGNPDLTFYAARSASATPVRFGPLAIVAQTNLFTISSQTAEQSFTYDNNLGVRVSVPIRQFAGVNSSFSFGADWKTYSAPTFGTNLTYASLYAEDSFGNFNLVTNETIALPANSSVSLNYIPLTYGWSAARPDKTGGFAFNFSQSIFLNSLASPQTNFQQAAETQNAGGTYTTINAGLAREQNLSHGWSTLLNINGQWASEALINNEQFALGGTSGVRGYQEAAVYGDTGWRVLFDLRAPPINVGYLPASSSSIPAILRCSAFMDYGQASLIDRPTTANLTYPEWGTGVGFYLTAGEHFDARLSLAWALKTLGTTHAGDIIAYFTVGAQF